MECGISSLEWVGTRTTWTTRVNSTGKAISAACTGTSQRKKAGADYASTPVT